MNKEVYQEGWLIKSPPTKRIWRARWRRRWFTLKQGEIPEQFCLEYYTDRNCRKLKGVIDLDQCEQVDSGLRLENRKQKFQYMFDIKTPRRTYYLAADTEDDMRDWVNCICQVCNLKDFTKQVGDRQYYNLYENGAQLATVDNSATNSLMSNRVEQHWQSLSCAEDVIRRTEELSVSGAYQNNDCSYVNTEYSNRETLICDTKFQEQIQQSQQSNQQDLCSKNDEILQKDLQLERSHSLKMSQVSKTDDVPYVSNGNKHLRTKSLNDQADVTPPAIAASPQPKSGLGPTTFATKKIPENLVLSDTFVDSNVEPSPALSTCSGPYIPISECFSGSPKYLNENNPTTPLNNLDPKFYDTPRSHNNVGLNLTSDQSYSPKIYNCPQQPRPRSGRSSPTDSESVFTDDEEWPHASPRRESIDRHTRPSDSSVENEAIVFTYAQRFSKIPEDSKSCGGTIDAGSECDNKRQAKMKSLILEDCDDDEKNREFPQYSDTDNSSPAIGPKDASSVVEESYDIPRSHQLAHYNKKQCNSNSTSPNLSCLKDSIASSTPNLAVDNQLTGNVGSKTLPRSHFYTNAAPCKIEGNVFRYDFMEQSDPPAVNRSLKPKLSLEEKTSSLELPLKSAGSGSRNSAESSPKPPSVDRKLKPAALKNADSTSNTNSLRRRVPPLSVGASFESDNMDSPKDFESRTLPRNSIHAGSVGNVSTSGTLTKASAGTTAKSNSQLQYFDLDVANPPSKAVNRSIYPSSSPSVAHNLSLNTSIDSVSRQPTKSNVIYNSVDFLRTEAIKKIREDAEKNRMKD